MSAILISDEFAEELASYDRLQQQRSGFLSELGATVQTEPFARG